MSRTHRELKDILKGSKAIVLTHGDSFIVDPMCNKYAQDVMCRAIADTLQCYGYATRVVESQVEGYPYVLARDMEDRI